MITNAKQAMRQLAIFTPLGEDELLLRKLNGREELSRLFSYELELLSENDAIAGSEILGRNVTFLVRPEGGEPRFFNGFVNHFCHAGRTELGTTYRATVVPWLWFLTQTADCRIFQRKTAPEIIEQIFCDLGFNGYDLAGLGAEYAAREYCVQYRESDFDFVSRLMEEEGIFYFFRHENGVHTLCLADRASAYFDLADKEVELGAPDQRGDLRDQLLMWEHRYRYRSGGWAQTDYNFQTPRRDLMTRHDSLVRLPNNRVFEVYDYPGRYEEPERGDRLTRIRMEEREAEHDIVCGTATYRSFTPGGKFKVISHMSTAEVGKQYVLTAVEHTASVNDAYKLGIEEEELTFQVKFECIPAEVPTRPPRRTAKPVVEGPQTAIVVGPPGEEIYPDEYGRVKVQFHWDREGSRDENSSCWIRVSQVHAGNGWGSIDLPRIGEEVIVGFLEGDPDRPIIKGRVYNGRNQPPFGLPGQMTRSGGKSDTHKGSGYNEITADDTAGAEQIRMNAQHNMDTTIGNNQTLAVGVDSSTDMGNNDTLTITVDAAEEVANNKSTRVGNQLDVVTGNHIVIEAGTAITLACGASTIHMNQAGVITISGTFVSSAAKANHCIVAPMTEIVGSNMLLQAGTVAMDLGGINHVKGSETSVNAASIDIDGGETLLIGSPLNLNEVGGPVVYATVPASAGKGGQEGSKADDFGAGGTRATNGSDGKQSDVGAEASGPAASAGDLVKNQREYGDLPERVTIPVDMDRQLREMMEESQRVDPRTGRQHERLAAIGIDGDGKLRMGPSQDTGPNGEARSDYSKVPPGTKFVGTAHTHPGDHDLSFSGSDAQDFLGSRDERVMIVQTGNKRYMAVKASDSAPPVANPGPNGSVIINQDRARQIARETSERARHDPNERESSAVQRHEANRYHLEATRVGYYEGDSGVDLTRVD